jgi:hypothetical protein
VRGERVEDDGAAHDIGETAEGLGERCQEDVAVGEDVYVGEAGDGIVDDEDKAMDLGLAIVLDDDDSWMPVQGGRGDSPSSSVDSDQASPRSDYLGTR